MGMWNGGYLSYGWLLMSHYKPRLRLPSGLPRASGVGPTLGAEMRMGEDRKGVLVTTASESEG